MGTEEEKDRTQNRTPQRPEATNHARCKENQREVERESRRADDELEMRVQSPGETAEDGREQEGNDLCLIDGDAEGARPHFRHRQRPEPATPGRSSDPRGEQGGNGES